MYSSRIVLFLAVFGSLLAPTLVQAQSSTTEPAVQPMQAAPSEAAAPCLAKLNGRLTLSNNVACGNALKQGTLAQELKDQVAAYRPPTLRTAPRNGGARHFPLATRSESGEALWRLANHQYAERGGVVGKTYASQ